MPQDNDMRRESFLAALQLFGFAPRNGSNVFERMVKFPEMAGPIVVTVLTSNRREEVTIIRTYSTNEEARDKVKSYRDALTWLINYCKQSEAACAN